MPIYSMMSNLRQLVRGVIAEELSFSEASIHEEDKHPKKGDPGYMPGWHDVGILQQRVANYQAEVETLHELVRNIANTIADKSIPYYDKLYTIGTLIIESDVQT